MKILIFIMWRNHFSIICVKFLYTILRRTFCVCVYLHTFSCYSHFMYGGHSISWGHRLSVRQDDLLTVDIWHWILKLQRRTAYRPGPLFFILFIKLILWSWMIALIFFYTDKKCTLKKSVSTKCWKITIKYREK